MVIQVIRENRRASEAAKYMAKELSDGTTLARLVLKRADFTRGSFRVALPVNVDSSRQLDFRQDVSSSDLHPDGDEAALFAGVIKLFIHDSDCTVLIQDTLKSMSDKVTQRLDSRHLAISYKAEVYWTLAGQELSGISDDDMVGIVYSASFYPFCAFFWLGRVANGKSSLSDADLERVANTLVGVAVGAFDDNSFLMWWRDDLRPFPTPQPPPTS
jgi:hypothetical protein